MIHVNQSDDDFCIHQSTDVGICSSVRLQFGPLETTLGLMVQEGFDLYVTGRLCDVGRSKPLKVRLARGHSESYTIGTIDVDDVKPLLSSVWSMPVRTRVVEKNLAEMVKFKTKWGVHSRYAFSRVSEQVVQDPWGPIQHKYPPIRAKQKVLFGNMRPVEWLRHELKDIERVA